MAYRNYSDDEKAMAIAYCDARQNVQQASKELKIPRTTLDLWLKQRNTPSSPSPESVTEKKEDMASRLDRLAELCITRGIEGVEEESAYHAVGMAEKCIVTARLLREQATSIISTTEPITREDKLSEAHTLAAKHGIHLEVYEPATGTDG